MENILKNTVNPRLKNGILCAGLPFADTTRVFEWVNHSKGEKKLTFYPVWWRLGGNYVIYEDVNIIKFSDKAFAFRLALPASEK